MKIRWFFVIIFDERSPLKPFAPFFKSYDQ